MSTTLTAEVSRQVIDLTRDPSPPAPAAPFSLPQHPPPVWPQPTPVAPQFQWPQATNTTLQSLSLHQPPPPPQNDIYPVSHQLPLPLPLPQVALSDEQPPEKRRRVDNAHMQGRSVKECLTEQVLPHVSREIKRLSHTGNYCINDIAEKTIIQLAKSSFFRRRLDETNGYLTLEDEVQLAQDAHSEVKRLSALEQYQLPPDIPRGLPRLEGVNNEDEAPVPEPAPESSGPPSTARLPFANVKAPEPPQRRDPADRPFLPLVRRPKPQQTSSTSDNPWFQVKQRPYRTAAEREQIRRGARRLKSANALREPLVYHVDFAPEEVAKIMDEVNTLFAPQFPPTLESLESVVKMFYPVNTIVGDKLQGRTSEDIRNFCSDLLSGKARPMNESSILSLGRNVERQRDHPQDAFGVRSSSLLLAREIEGNVGFGRMRSYHNFQTEFKTAREDGLDLIAEFTNCAGDIATISWVSDKNLICGTTAHSDSHNQQYNKPGNLLLCSMAQGTLRALPDHRIPRPLVEKGENSTEAMRQSQDPWLYSSVVSSDYDPATKRAYTSSFDKTVKVWKVDEEGKVMELLATWHHEGNVNFVAAAKDGSGRVASAADVPTQAVRIYTIDNNDIANSPYEAFSCSRTDALDTNKWAYYPATMQWGKIPGTQHLLAVGYSPRSLSEDDSDIPEEKRDSGEITLWDADAGRRIPVMTATTANVFEITWHPTLPRFICATSPCGLTVEHRARTQIHLFQRDRDRVEQAYCEYQSLDCMASDINELTIMPNSLHHAYVTAACTDGKVYVWDTAHSENPIHVLKHGESLDGFEEDREKLDTGVKFTAWGTTPDRFYTGSSDGIVKVWNVRNWRKPLKRTLLEAPGPISSGAFSPDMAKLAIGDATGRVFLFSLDKRDEPETHYKTAPGLSRKIRRPVPFLPHPEPPPPEQDSNAMQISEDENSDIEEDIVEYSRRTYLDTEQLAPTRNPVIGVVQGPNYPTTNIYRREAHEDDDPSKPLLTAYERQQKQSLRMDRGIRRRSLMRLREPALPDTRLEAMHSRNTAKDLDIKLLAEHEIAELLRAGAELDPDKDETWAFNYEESDYEN